MREQFEVHFGLMLKIKETSWDNLIQNCIDSCPWKCGDLGIVWQMFIMIKTSIHLPPSSFYWHPLKENTELICILDAKVVKYVHF